MVICEKQEELNDESVDIVIKKPVIRKDHPAVVKAKDLDISVINEMEVAYQFIPKDVTVYWNYWIQWKNYNYNNYLWTFGIFEFQCFLGGNIGIPLSSIVNEIQSKDLLVLEISDHQLCDMYDFKTNVSALTNLSEVHIDFHGTYEQYKNTKKKIFNHNTNEDIAILNKENKDILELTNEQWNSFIRFNSSYEVS